MTKKKAKGLKPGEILKFEGKEWRTLGLGANGYEMFAKPFGEEVEFVGFDGVDMYEAPVLRVKTKEGERSFSPAWFE